MFIVSLCTKSIICYCCGCGGETIFFLFYGKLTIFKTAIHLHLIWRTGYLKRDQQAASFRDVHLHFIVNFLHMLGSSEL